MVVITLVGELQAKVGETFVYCGPLGECRECKLKTICFNLDVGRWYRVSSVRDKRHECRIHEGGVRVVEAEAVGAPASIPRRWAIEGTTITFEPRGCSSISCDNYRLCHPIGLQGGAKYLVSTVEKDVACEGGQALKKVILS